MLLEIRMYWSTSQILIVFFVFFNLPNSVFHFVFGFQPTKSWLGFLINLPNFGCFSGENNEENVLTNTWPPQDDWHDSLDNLCFLNFWRRHTFSSELLKKTYINYCLMNFWIRHNLSSELSPWYDFRGWLGVKQQISIYLSSELLKKTSIVFLTFEEYINYLSSELLKKT